MKRTMLILSAIIVVLITTSCSGNKSANIPSDKGGTISNSDGFSLYFAPNVLTDDTKVSVKVSNDPPASFPNDSIQVGRVYEITVEKGFLNDQAFITIPYNPKDLPDNISENELAISYFADDIQKWVSLPSQVNPDEHTITASTSHFSIFTIIGGWISGNKPPVIVDFKFMPTSYYADCDQITMGDQWFYEHPERLILIVSDPDGNDDIESNPEVVLQAERAFARDNYTEPVNMYNVASGEYQLEWTLNQGADAAFAPMAQALFNGCGNLRTYNATVRVTDTAGHVVERTAIQDIRYEPIPEIRLISPTMDELSFGFPVLSWNIEWADGVFEKYEKITLVVSTDKSLKSNPIKVELRPDETSYELPTSKLKKGQRYYWQITVEKPDQPIGSTWAFVRSETANFVLKDLGDVLTDYVNLKCNDVLAYDISGVGVIEVNDTGESWTISIDSSGCKVKKGSNTSYDAKLMFSHIDDVSGVINGKIDPYTLLSNGEISFEGDQNVTIAIASFFIGNPSP